jgi:hypothetical protein
MPLTLQELDKKIRQTEEQLAELREFRSLFAKYGEIGASNGHIRHASAKKRARVASNPAAPPNANGLKDAILALSFTTPFTVDDLVDALRSKGHHFNRRQVRDSVHILVKKAKGLRRVKQGLGGKPSMYERVSV